MEHKYGEWAFLAGVLISLIVGVFSTQFGSNLTLIYGILALLGLVVGFLNIRDKETNSFLIATIVLLSIPSGLTHLINLMGVVGSLGSTIGTWLQGFLSTLGVFVAPAALVVALKAVYNLARGKSNR